MTTRMASLFHNLGRNPLSSPEERASLPSEVLLTEEGERRLIIKFALKTGKRN